MHKLIQREKSCVCKSEGTPCEFESKRFNCSYSQSEAWSEWIVISHHFGCDRCSKKIAQLHTCNNPKGQTSKRCQSHRIQCGIHFFFCRNDFIKCAIKKILFKCGIKQCRNEFDLKKYFRWLQSLLNLWFLLFDLISIEMHRQITLSY